MTRLLALSRTVALALTLLLPALPAAAAENETPRGAFNQIFQDGVSGGAVGGLVGLALLAFVDSPSDHLEYISTGAAVGVLAGVGWGLWRTTRTPPYLRPAVRREDGLWHVALPEPEVIWSRSLLHPTPDPTIVWRLAGLRF
ncbi:MAG: hypothetical protein OEY97_03335 [Nitrospirota bacterium]|nr:hypothetical protein [Nitrospirota bacterium]